MKHWEKIPLNTDVLITHGSPYGILDYTKYKMNVGCEELLKKVKLIKPKCHLFGHIHEAYGVYNDEATTYMNGSILNEDYNITNEPILFEINPELKI